MQSINKHKLKNTFALNSNYRQSWLAFLVSSFLVLLVGCANASPDKPAPLNDANIAAIVVGANNIDISAGKIAIDRSKNEEVRRFAQRMIEDHSAVLDAAVALVTKLGVTPVNNELVATLASQSQAHEKQLLSLSGKDFDKSYIDHEVAYHKAVIGVIKTQLIPSAQNAELKDMLVNVLPAFEAHLKHCQMIQSQI
ncbi:MAG: DUF4142 domain-containing protein [bacterium]